MFQGFEAAGSDPPQKCMRYWSCSLKSLEQNFMCLCVCVSLKFALHSNVKRLNLPTYNVEICNSNFTWNLHFIPMWNVAHWNDLQISIPKFAIHSNVQRWNLQFKFHLKFAIQSNVKRWTLEWIANFKWNWMNCKFQVLYMCQELKVLKL